MLHSNSGGQGRRRGTGVGFEDSTSLEPISFLADPWEESAVHTPAGEVAARARRPLAPPCYRLRWPGAGPGGSQRPWSPAPRPARAPVACSLPTEPPLGPPPAWRSARPRPTALRAWSPRGLGSPHLHPEGLSPLRPSNAEGLRINAVRACAASHPQLRLRAAPPPARQCAGVLSHGRALRSKARRLTAWQSRHHQLSGSAARVRRRVRCAQWG